MKSFSFLSRFSLSLDTSVITFTALYANHSKQIILKFKILGVLECSLNIKFHYKCLCFDLSEYFRKHTLHICDLAPKSNATRQEDSICILFIFSSNGMVCFLKILVFNPL